jgi:hypothetical protein
MGGSAPCVRRMCFLLPWISSQSRNLPRDVPEKRMLVAKVVPPQMSRILEKPMQLLQSGALVHLEQ